VTLLATVLACFPAAAFAVPMSQQTGQDTSVQTQLKLAKLADADGRWAEACYYYEQVLAADRNQPELKKRFLFCLRQCHRKIRLDDSSFTAPLLSPQMRLSETLEFYKDAVRKVQELYVSSDRAQLSRLFQEGLEELIYDLDDGEFRVKFLRPGISASEVLEFRNLLRQKWGNAKPKNVDEAASELRAIAKEASRKLDLNGKLVVVEFACGACNALDEYSFYMTQGSLLTMPADKGGLEAEMVDKGVGCIRLTSFDDSTPAAVATALQELRMHNMQVLVLDLRNNLGGSLESAVGVVEQFVPAPQPIASTSGKLNKTYQSFSMNVADMPMFVLVNGNTASAAELVAGALKTNKRAELVGQTTFGKSLIQKMVPVSMAPFGAVRLTWAKFHLPKPDEMSKQTGIVPTIATDVNQEETVAVTRARALMGMR
jgi:hypothetical protein